MLKKLIKKQESLMPVIIDKWIDIVLNKQTRKLDVITKNIRFLYEDNGFSFEDVEIKVCNFDEFIKEVKNSAVYSAVNSAIYSAVDSAVYSAVDSAVYSAVRSAVRSAVYSAVRSAVYSAVRSAVYSAVDSAVYSAVYYRADDIAFGDYFFKNGTLIDKKLKDRFYKYVDVIQDFGMIYLTEKKAILLAKPKIILDNQGQTRELRWNKNCSLYFIDGVQFEKKWYNKIINDKFKPEEIFAIDNLEHRRIAYRYMDKTKMKKLKNYKVLDEIKDDGYGYKMKIISFKVKGVEESLKYLNCFCCSTGREYYIGTNEDKCWDAKYKSFGLDKIDFIKEF